MNRLKIHLLALIMALMALCGIAPAHATTAPIPVADLIKADEAPNPWRRMNVDSFPRTFDAAVGQCERDARHSGNDRLTLAHCTTFRRKLEAGECGFVSVPDGQAYGFMNGPGRVYPGMTKRTGRNDVASRCNLGDNIYADWFNGQPGVSCFNVGIIIGNMPTPDITTEKTRKSCRYVTTVRQSPVSQGGIFVPSLYLPSGCCCGPLYTSALYIPSNISTDKSVETTMVCD